MQKNSRLYMIKEKKAVNQEGKFRTDKNNISGNSVKPLVENTKKEDKTDINCRCKDRDSVGE
jgi:hypothetical protein